MNTDIRMVVAFVLFIAFGFITGWGASEMSSEDFDCVSDYSGAIVVESHSHGEYILTKDGCSYETVRFPALYNYSLGDTVCSDKSFIKVYEAREDILNNLYIQYNNKIEKAIRDKEVQLIELEAYRYEK